MPKPKESTLDQAGLLQAKRAVEGSAVNEKISEIAREITFLEAENRVLEESIASGGESEPKILAYLSSKLCESTAQIQQLEARVLAAEDSRNSVIASLMALADTKEAHAQEISALARQREETIEEIRSLISYEKELPELDRRRVELTANLHEIRQKNKAQEEVVFLAFSYFIFFGLAFDLCRWQASSQMHKTRISASLEEVKMKQERDVAAALAQVFHLSFRET